MTEEIELKWISGFWRRIGALLIDSLLLSAVGLLLGLLFENVFAQMGGWGRLVGFSLGLVYFGVMNSSIAGGQTVGKKLLKIRVVDFKNAPISLGKSVLRYFVLAIPFSLNGAQFSNEVMFSVFIYLLSLIIFGGLLSITYLYVFNRISRQSLHDLIVGTYVVNASAERNTPEKVWGVHLITVAVFFLAAAVVPVFTNQLVEKEAFKGMAAVQSALVNESDIAYASVYYGSSTFSSSNEGTKTTTYVSSEVVLKTNNVSDVDLARQLALITVENYPEALEKDTLQIVLNYGYDIGVASKWRTHSHEFNPSELVSEKSL